MPKVTFISGKEKKEVEVPEGANLREEAMKAGLPVYRGLHRFLNCHGLGLCGTCAGTLPAYLQPKPRRSVRMVSRTPARRASSATRLDTALSPTVLPERPSVKWKTFGPRRGSRRSSASSSGARGTHWSSTALTK